MGKNNSQARDICHSVRDRRYGGDSANLEPAETADPGQRRSDSVAEELLLAVESGTLC